MKSRYDKLMAVANDPNASPEERAAYRAKAEALAKDAPRVAKRTKLTVTVTRDEKGHILNIQWTRDIDARAGFDWVKAADL